MSQANFYPYFLDFALVIVDIDLLTVPSSSGFGFFVIGGLFFALTWQKPVLRLSSSPGSNQSVNLTYEHSAACNQMGYRIVEKATR